MSPANGKFTPLPLAAAYQEWLAVGILGRKWPSLAVERSIDESDHESCGTESAGTTDPRPELLSKREVRNAHTDAGHGVVGSHSEGAFRQTW